MSRTPALQDLAFYARDCLEDGNYPPGDGAASSFDAVLDLYVREADESDVEAHASAVLHRRLQTQGYVAGQADVDEFVRETVTYLKSQYPRASEAKQDQAILSHLFRAHVGEARLARAASRMPALVS